ncbi:DUF4936 family protein [Roseateles sp.]|uniref:DUF4936 family protein n=1 Tax=Roseateles sp. TaxID=1971397 RepID=UPI003BA6A254
MSQTTETVELYVYYKLDPAQAEEARRAFDLGFAAGVRLLQRQDSGADGSGSTLLTWMEIYRGPKEAVFALEAQVAQALAPFITAARHQECFRPLMPGMPSMPLTPVEPQDFTKP